MTSINEIHTLIDHHRDLHIDHHLDEIHVLDIDDVHTVEIDTFHNILRHIDVLLKHETLNISDLDQTLQQKENNTVQTEQSNSHINFEIHMYHSTEMANALTPTSWFYSLYLHTPERHNDNDHPSRLEISVLLYSGASISVLNYPTYLTIAKHLNLTCNNNANHTSKILTVGNQTEVPILHYLTTTLNTSIEQTSRQFIIPFAVGDI